MKSLLTLVLSCFVVLLSAQLYRDQVQVILDQQNMSDIQFADLDQDGDLDFIGNRFGYNGSYLTFFNEDGNYAPPVPFGDTSWWGLPDIEINFALGDMDNDGDIDLIPGNIAAAPHPVWANDGTGAFSYSSQQHYSHDVWDNQFFRIADLDQDGQQDIVIFRRNTRKLFYNRNLGNGEEFVYTELYDAFDDFAPSYPSDFKLFDFDLDGDLDLGFMHFDPYVEDFNDELVYFSLYEQTCDLCFTLKSRTVVDTAVKYVLSAEVNITDFDGDNYPDLMVRYVKSDEPNLERNYFRVLENDNGTGDFNFVYERKDVQGQSFADIDNDGDQDIFMSIDPDSTWSSGGYAQYYWQENQGDFNFQEYFIDELFSGNHLVIKDINHDGLPDLLSLRGSSPGTAFKRIAQNDLSFSSPEIINISTTHVRQIATEDTDDDGDLDLLFFGDVSLSGAHADGIYRQSQLADGGFSPPSLVYPLAEDGYPKDFVDFNNDGKLDAIGFEHIYGPGSNRKFIYTLQQADGSWSPGIRVDTILPQLPANFLLADWNNDGDQDILTKNHDGEYYLLENDLDGSGSFLAVPVPDLFFTLPAYHNERTFTADINGDNYADLISVVANNIQWALGTSESLQFTDWDTIPLPFTESIYELHPCDWDNDGDQDLLLKLRSTSSNIIIAVSLFDQASQQFMVPRLLANNDYISAQGTILDLNHDGYPDYMSGLGFRLNQLNGRLLSAPFIPEPQASASSYIPVLPSAFAQNAVLATIGATDDQKIISGDREILAYPIDFLSTSTLSGFVRWDTTAQCQIDSILPPLENWQISIESPERELLSTTNTLGQYGSILPDTGNYQIQAIPPSGYWAACPTDTLLQVTDNQSAYQIDFAAEALVDCPLLVIDISSTTISQCFGSAVSIGFYNAGTAIGSNVEITVQHDPRFLPVNSNYPWEFLNDSTLIFAIPDIGIGERGRLSIQFEPECQDLEIGEEVCFEASITPNELCEDMLLNWDGANLEANVICTNDMTAYRITNTGEGAMSMPVNYQLSIVNDDIILYLDGTVILAPGESDTIPLPANDDLWYLQVYQTLGHPYPVPIGLFTNHCTDNQPTPAPHLLPTGTGDPFRVVLCRQVIGPYDPNDKSAFPTGLTAAHYIQRDWPLDYTIQFQNVGSDRARNVILADTLSPHLDLSSFTPLTASHEYEWFITDSRLLQVTFPNINLPDSTNNEVGSHGFFSFRIKPKAQVSFETDIYNAADIYFDFNPPIRTGTTQHRIRKPQRSGSIFVELCAGESYLGQTIHQDTILKETLLFTEYDSTTFYHITALSIPITNIPVELIEPGIWEGIFIQQDTLIQQIFTAENNCDSLVNFTISILTSVNELEAEVRLQMHPNPATDATLLQWNGGQTLEQIQIINSTGQVLQTLFPRGATASYQLPLQHLISGSYQLILRFDQGQVRRRLQVIQ